MRAERICGRRGRAELLVELVCSTGRDLERHGWCEHRNATDDVLDCDEWTLGLPSFPDLLLRDGTIENASFWPIESARSRFFVVADLQEGLAEARNAATGEGLRLRWDASVLPHLWVWHEARVSRGRWRSQTELLGIEPAMVPHSLGLDAAIASGHARLVSAHTPLSWWVEAKPLGPT